VRIYLAHGASGSAATMKPWIDALHRHGLDARAVGLPRGTAERALPVYRAQIEKGGDVVVGGHSFGGRVASMLAAESEPSVAGLVLLSYPLHRPGHPSQLRTEHWPRILCPTLLLSGESDPFARIDQLREATQELANAELVTYPGIGHGLVRVLDDAVDRIDEFIGRIGTPPAPNVE
jgi:predicted alpha/beta-hydrolase family hydrolase